MGDKDKRRMKSSGLGLAIWILAFLILVIIFLVKADDIKRNLEQAKVFERLFGKTPSFLKTENVELEEKKDDSETIALGNKKENHATKKTEAVSQENLKNKENQETPQIKAEDKKSSLEKENESGILKNEKKSDNPENLKSMENVSALNRQTTPAKENRIEAAAKTSLQKNEANPAETKKNSTGTNSKSLEENADAKASEAEKIAERKLSNTIAAKICFVAIDSDGPVIRKEVGRSVAKDSPLTDSIISLLNGPAASESATGCRTLIPAGTKLYSASVKNGVATLDFSEEFEFNPYGVEGYLGQLMQIVYTATNFSTVDSVQILIEGQKKGYLGSEGVWIGSPLSRASFR